MKIALGSKPEEEILPNISKLSNVYNKLINRKLKVLLVYYLLIVILMIL